MKTHQVILLIIFLLTQVFAYGEEMQSVYFGGYVRHKKPEARTHEGNMSLIGYSR
jgi:hypothetical protein